MLVENYQYYFKEDNKDGSSRWVCKTNKCSASITIKDQSVIKVNGKKLDSEDDLSEKIKSSHKEHCKPLSEAEKICMDFNQNLKKIVQSSKYFKMSNQK